MVATEILCRGKGDKICKFIMTSPSKIDELLLQFTDDLRFTKEQRQAIIVPVFLETIHTEKYTFEGLSEGVSPKLSELKRSKSHESLVANKLYRSNKDQINLETKVARQTSQFYKDIKSNPLKSNIAFRANEEDRIFIVRSKGLSQELFSAVKGSYSAKPDPDSSAHRFASHYLFDLGKLLGASEQKRFVFQTNYTDANIMEQIYGLSVFWQYTGNLFWFFRANSKR